MALQNLSNYLLRPFKISLASSSIVSISSSLGPSKKASASLRASLDSKYSFNNFHPSSTQNSNLWIVPSSKTGFSCFLYKSIDSFNLIRAVSNALYLFYNFVI